MDRPLILATNDDGIASPGLKASVRAVLPLGDVLVVAPTRQQTAMSRSLWGSADEYLQPIEFKVDGVPVPAYHCDCSPAHTVWHAMDVLCAKRRPQLLVAGINYGENLGLNVTLSGTIGAASQAAAMGVPAIAVSLETELKFHFTYGDLDWAAAGHFTTLFAARVLERHLPPDVHVLKIDVPREATARTPWRITRMALQPYYTFRVADPTPLTRIRDKEVVKVHDDATLARDSDVHTMVHDRLVSVTPLSLDATSRADVGALRRLLEGGGAIGT